jgi:hypothetical protein
MPDRFVREIEEILEETEKLDSSNSLDRHSKKDSGTSDRIDKPVGLFKSSNMMLTGICFLLIAAGLKQIVPGAVYLLVGAGIGMFVGAYFLFFIKPNSNKYKNKWRGQAIETEAVTSLWSRVINSFRRRY